MTTTPVLPETVMYGPDGLVPAIVQDRADGRVLMLAYMDAEALAATLATGEVHFHSRKRNRLWKKGEESGNVLRLVSIEADCDADSLLVQADPAGPTCHSGTRSCFDASHPEPIACEAPSAPGTQGFAWLEGLWSTIEARAAADPAESYTARLLAKGVYGPSRKVAEEAVEVLMAAKDDAVAQASAPADREATTDALTGEVADLLYHTLVVLRERGLPPSAVIARLRERHRP
jgi:phosphoribosyl-AMP cyclohydrolase / phosphoribosyl-ATP pyrophosphohydrolase